jgi:pSer/pThr/pTyr-binding forkhead associated (FHA) protein
MQRPTAPPPVRVELERDGSRRPHGTFTASFRIGRDARCDVRLDADVVSRVHTEVRVEDGRWWVRDLGSTNGTWVDGARIERVPLDGEARVQLAHDGPILRLVVERRDDEPRRRPKTAPRPASIEQYIQRYVDGDGEEAGDHTMMIRSAVAAVRARQRRRYRWMIGVALAGIVAVAGYAVVQYTTIQAARARERKIALKMVRQQKTAAAVFDDMKVLDLQMSQLRLVIEGTGNAQLTDQLRRLEQSRQRMASRYDGYVKNLGVYRRLKRDERVIYRMARVFNESEFGMPAGFVERVKSTVQDYWLSPAGRGRFLRSIREAAQNGYTPFVVQTMQKHGLPVQLFYLALQESDLNPKAIGPLTRWGRAKGMWQFIPSTATLYELDPGPYPDKSMIDPHDERHDFRKSTEAAARYLQTMYGTLAQASGLLVIASYNWGAERVVDRAAQLPGPQAIPKESLAGIPENPSERNYWSFLGKYEDRMPEETKDYVLKIFAASVLGEDPRQFGLDLDNPLEPYMEQVP